MNPADKDIRELSDRLGLVYYEQDWGICNANAGRLGDFLQTCRTGGLTPPQQYAMVELVLASMNEALAGGADDARIVRDLDAFVGMGLHGLDPQIRYWASLPDGEEFPLAGLLGRELLARPFVSGTP
jgi:hypothetical protein